MLTEKEAWLKLADAWDKAEWFPNAYIYRVPLGASDHREFVIGLCLCIDIMFETRLIDRQARNAMSHKIKQDIRSKSADHDLLDNVRSQFLFSTLSDTSKERAEYCREKASRIAE
jgi:hypothetical protein